MSVKIMQKNLHTKTNRKQFHDNVVSVHRFVRKLIHLFHALMHYGIESDFWPNKKHLPVNDKWVAVSTFALLWSRESAFLDS